MMCLNIFVVKCVYTVHIIVVITPVKNIHHTFTFVPHVQSQSKTTTKHQTSRSLASSPTAQPVHKHVAPKPKKAKPPPVPTKPSQSHSSYSRAHTTVQVEKKKSEKKSCTHSQKCVSSSHVHKQSDNKVKLVARRFEQVASDSEIVNIGRSREVCRSPVSSTKAQSPKKSVGLVGKVTKSSTKHSDQVVKATSYQKEQQSSKSFISVVSNRAPKGCIISPGSRPVHIVGGLSPQQRMWSSTQDLSSSRTHKSHTSSSVSLANCDSRSVENISSGCCIHKVSVFVCVTVCLGHGG